MTDEQNENLLQDLGEASTRLIGGQVPRKTMQDLQRLTKGADSYPWQEVVQRILADPVPEQTLVQQALKGQRDWVLRGGRETPKKSLKRHTKGFFAAILVKLGFFLFYTAMVVLLLNLVRHRWPDLNIYWFLDWAKETFPSWFAG